MWHFFCCAGLRPALCLLVLIYHSLLVHLIAAELHGIALGSYPGEARFLIFLLLLGDDLLYQDLADIANHCFLAAFNIVRLPSAGHLHLPTALRRGRLESLTCGIPTVLLLSWVLTLPELRPLDQRNGRQLWLLVPTLSPFNTFSGRCLRHSLQGLLCWVELAIIQASSFGAAGSRT